MEGWILDVYPSYRENEIVIWIKQKDDKTIRLTGAFKPVFYVSAAKRYILDLLEKLEKHSAVNSISYENSKTLIDGEKPKNLLKIECKRFYDIARLAEGINKAGEFSRYLLYNVDIPPALAYLFKKHVTPMVLLKVKNHQGFLQYELLEDPNALTYKTPKLSEVSIDLEIAKKGKFAKMDDPLGNLTLKTDDDFVTFDGDETEIITDFSKTIQKIDPDILLTYRGDSFLFPYLNFRVSENKLEKEFQLGREPTSYKKREGKTYFTYGRIVYKPPSYSIKGRVHIDKSSFMFKESGLQGLIDLSRISGVPLQRNSRISPGSAITTMQRRFASENNILVPWKRQNPEYFKTGWDLLYSDRGGYIFEPKVGIFKNVAEVDFSSMYPAIMKRFNISPETVLCKCCKDSSHRVPVLDYNICEKRTGLVPLVLGPLIDRRSAYKKLLKNARGDEREIYDQRQKILKWILVTSFGYQGYRNARFGRIEGHESICAFGRELMLKAKEIVEDFNFEVIHGIVDSLWIKKETDKDELLRLCSLITEEIGIDLNLEGRYRWIVFLPNRSNGVGALNRYYGLFEDGKLKVRGIETRMKNTPQIIIDYQSKVLEELQKTETVEEFYAALPRTFKILRRYVADIKEERVDYNDLIFSITITRDIRDYRQRNFSFAALKQLQREGIKLKPGQSVKYIVTDHRARRPLDKARVAEGFKEDDSYDKEFYITHLLRATESLFSPFGYTQDRLNDILNGNEQSTLQKFAIKAGGV